LHMDTNTIIESLGYILKEEKLLSVKQHFIPNTLVLEIQNPFHGYHGKFQPEEAIFPEFFFFVTREKYPTEQIYRTTTLAQKYFGHEFNVARTEIHLFNSVYQSLRIKGCKDYSRAIELQTWFKGEGIRFAKSKKIESTGLIKLQKTFKIKEIADGIFHDLNNPNIHYLQMPSYIGWDYFKPLTARIKNTMKRCNFDAAQALFYRNQGVVDLVRIFDKDATMDKLLDIKERYLEEVKKFLLDKYNIL
jgi:hypothetical protein